MKWVESSADSAAEEETPTEEAVEPWSLYGSHFIVSAERLTSFVAWSKETTSEVQSYYYPTSFDSVQKTTGVDVSLLGAGGAVRSPSSLPRLAFDGVLSMGLTIGGSLSYVGSGGQTELGGASAELSDLSIFVFAPRVGALLRVSPTLGIWLRGGISRTSVVGAGSFTSTDGSSVEVEETATLWHASIDPQLVLVAAPHVAFTLAALLDIGLPGTVETKLSSSATATADQTASGYGLSAGLAAIF